MRDEIEGVQYYVATPECRQRLISRRKAAVLLDHSCQMAIAGFLDRTCLALRA